MLDGCDLIISLLTEREMEAHAHIMTYIRMYVLFIVGAHLKHCKCS